MSQNKSMPADAIATVNGVKGGTFHLTIRRQARGGDLQGSLATVGVDTEAVRQRALIRIGCVDRSNPIHDNPAMQPLLMDKGSIRPFSGDCDYETADAEVVSCLSIDTGKIEGIRSNPPSGSTVVSLTSTDLLQFMNEREFYTVIGHEPRREDVPVSLVCKDFGPSEDQAYKGKRRGGLNEAHHSIFAGQNGSGKTVAALSFGASLLAMHPQMGCLIPDTAGDISRHGSHHSPEFKFSFIELLEHAGRSVTIVGIDQVRLESVDTFVSLLGQYFRKALGNVKPENAADLADAVAFRELRVDGERPIDLDVMTGQAVLAAALNAVPRAWSSGPTRAAKQADIQDILSNPNSLRVFCERYERQVCKYFKGGRSLADISKGFLEDGEIILLRLDSMSPHDQRFVMAELFQHVRRHAAKKYHRENERMVNALIVLDEGPTWVPEGSSDPIAEIVKDSYRQTRKQGLGWLVITQRLADISKTVLSEARNKFFGRNLTSKTDLDHIENLIGKDGVEHYKRLGKQGVAYPWVITGECVNVGIGSNYTTLETFGGDATAKLMEANPHIWKNR